MATARSTTPYHHGDLRAALLRAGEEVLAERGIAGFTLRECARRAGVSHAAPAHHFGDVRGFLAELAAAGFDRLTASMVAYRSRAAPAPSARLQAIGEGYVAFAQRNPALFQIMFQRGTDMAEAPNLRRAGAAAFGVLQEAMQAMLAEQADPAPLAAALALAWSTVHGLATLLIEGQLAACAEGKNGPELAGALTAPALALMTRALLPPGRVP